MPLAEKGVDYRDILEIFKEVIIDADVEISLVCLYKSVKLILLRFGLMVIFLHYGLVQLPEALGKGFRSH